MSTKYKFEGLGPGYFLLDGSGNVSAVKIAGTAFFDALTLLSLSSTSVIPVGNSSITIADASDQQAALFAVPGTLTTFFARHNGRVANNLVGHTVSYDLYHNNALIQTIAHVPAGPVSQSYSGSVSFTRNYAAGDFFVVKVTPDNPLVASVTDIEVGIG